MLKVEHQIHMRLYLLEIMEVISFFIMYLNIAQLQIVK